MADIQITPSSINKDQDQQNDEEVTYNFNYKSSNHTEIPMKLMNLVKRNKRREKYIKSKHASKHLHCYSTNKCIIITVCIALLISLVIACYYIIRHRNNWEMHSDRIYEDFDTYSFVSKSNLPDLVVYPHWIGQYNQTNSNNTSKFSAFIAQINNNTKLSFEIPDNCSMRQPVSTTSLQRECEYATNGGFFSFEEPYCLSQLISNGKRITIDTNSNEPKTTIAFDRKNNTIFIGYININETNINKWYELLSGKGWLIRKGNIYVNQSIDIDIQSLFVQEKAPRTGLGIYENGSLILLQVDGQEDINYGMDLWEFAALFKTLQVVSAINLDGGGSSTSVFKNELINRPTCVDNSTICERDVTSIVCVRG